jgi:hypothetical protein
VPEQLFTSRFPSPLNRNGLMTLQLPPPLL